MENLRLARVAQAHDRYIPDVGFVSGASRSATWPQADNIRRFRLRPAADMRYIKDALNAPTAESWLETGATKSAKTTTDAQYRMAYANEWTEWQELDKDPSKASLTNLYMSLDSNVSSAEVMIEAESFTEVSRGAYGES